MVGSGFGVLYKGAATGAPPFTGWMILEGVDKGEGTDPGAVTVETGGLTTGAFFGGVTFPCTVDGEGTTSYGGDDPIGG